MRVVGIVAEYDPFHLGHAYQLEQARSLSGADAVAVVMSGPFTQRGEPSLLSPAARTEMALRGGADAVITLPVLWALRDAEHFALGGMAILKGIGADAVSFGAEDEDSGPLSRCAELLEEPDGSFTSALHEELSAGLPYPLAQQRALSRSHPAEAELLSRPNNTLAVCYLRAMKRLNWSPDVYPVRRGNDYHDSCLAPGAFSSASAVRDGILRGDWSAVFSALPPASREILRREALQGHLCRPDAADSALLWKLRSMSPEQASFLPDLSEGLQDRLLRCAGSAATREELLNALKSRRYPRARLSRLCACALLGITREDPEACPLPPAALLAGVRKDAKGLPGRLAQGSLPLIGRISDCDPTARWLQVEALARDLRALGAGCPSGSLWTDGVIRV